MKKTKKKQKERTLVPHLLLIMLLSFLEPILIIAGFLPPIFTNSLGNILFIIAAFAIVAHLAFSRADEKLRESFLNGLALGFASASIICALGLVGATFYSKPVVGIASDSQQSRLLVLCVVIILSAVIFALFSAFVTWLTKKLKRPSPQ